MAYESRSANQAGQSQLDIVAAQFDEWRSQKTTRSARIPEALLREAKKLTEHLVASSVRRRLGITKGQLDKLDATVHTTTNKGTGETDFMQLIPTQRQSLYPELTIDICTPSGVKISLSGLSHKDPLAIIATLIDGSAC